MVRQFRGNNEVLNNDVYWNLGTGRVFQYQGASNYSGADVAFTEITSTGVLSLQGIKDAFTGGSSIRFEEDNIQILENNKLRVKLGRL